MTNILIRDVDETLIEDFKKIAREQGITFGYASRTVFQSGLKKAVKENKIKIKE